MTPTYHITGNIIERAEVSIDVSFDPNKRPRIRVIAYVREFPDVWAKVPESKRRTLEYNISNGKIYYSGMRRLYQASNVDEVAKFVESSIKDLL